jgi:phospholipase D1/2
VDHTLDEQGTQQEPRGEGASTNVHSVKACVENLAHLTNAHARGGTPKGEKSITEKPAAPSAGEKTGSAMHAEKTNGSGKKNKGEPPFTKQEMEEKEALLNDLCGHLGQPLEFQYSAALQGLTDVFN